MTNISKREFEGHERPVLDVHRNSYRARIYKCCMSCDHKGINSLGKRICEVHKKFVDKYDVCPKWVLAIGLERAGAGGGEVDVHCYERFLSKRNEEGKQEAGIHQQ